MVILLVFGLRALLTRLGGVAVARSTGAVQVLSRVGRMPLPPYIRKARKALEEAKHFDAMRRVVPRSVVGRVRF